MTVEIERALCDLFERRGCKYGRESLAVEVLRLVGERRACRCPETMRYHALNCPARPGELRNPEQIDNENLLLRAIVAQHLGEAELRAALERV